MKRILICLTALALGGCMTVEKALNGLPLISAREMHIEKNTLYGSVRIDAKNLIQGETETVADELTVTTSTPFTGSTSVRVEGYSRTKRPTPAK